MSPRAVVKCSRKRPRSASRSACEAHDALDGAEVRLVAVGAPLEDLREGRDGARPEQVRVGVRGLLNVRRAEGRARLVGRVLGGRREVLPAHPHLHDLVRADLPLALDRLAVVELRSAGDDGQLLVVQDQLVERGDPMPGADLAGVHGVVPEEVVGDGAILVAEQPVGVRPAPG